MASDSALPPVIGAIADDRDGNALGTITTVFLDDVTEQPTWVGLTPGLHAHPDTDDVPVIAPVTGSDFTDGRLRLAVSAEAVHSAPRASAPDRLSPAEETQLRSHYAAAPAAVRSGDTAMTRSEEQLAVTTVVEPWTRAVLRIEEFTEEVMVPVTVTRQRARIEHLPLTRSDSTRTAADAPGTSRATSTTGWVTLYADEPVVTVERRPAERVRLATSWVTEEVMVPVTVTRQRARIEHLPLGPADRTSADAGSPGTSRATSTTGWVTLYADEPVVTVERRPAERVRLATSWVTEETTVSGELRREQIELTTTETPLG